MMIGKKECRKLSNNYFKTKLQKNNKNNKFNQAQAKTNVEVVKQLLISSSSKQKSYNQNNQLTHFKKRLQPKMSYK